MPKSKSKKDDTSDSDEGPVDRNPPAAKKARTDEDGEKTWFLDKRKKVTVRSFKGKTYIDVREFYEKDGNLLPGKKGVSLTPEVWRKLISLSEEINEAVSSM